MNLLSAGTELDGGFLDFFLELHVAEARHKVQHLGEEIVEQTHEDAVIVGGELAEVEITQRLEQHLVLRQIRLIALHAAGDVQRRLDGAKLPIVVWRGGEEILAQLVQDDELARENLGHVESPRP